jgi:hypothetical protein
VGGKNSADIRLVVDAMDMSFQKEHINCFVVASGDSDFSPLVSKLKENNKYVIGLGVKNSTSDLLIENCDEFIFYEDLVRVQQRPLPVISGAPEKLQECFSLLVDAVVALQRENKEVLWGSMVKETMKRKKPSFNETYYGFRTFSHLLEDAQRRGIVILRRDQRSGSYIVEDLGPGSTATVKTDHPAPVVAIHAAAPVSSAPSSASTAPPPASTSGEAGDSAEAQNGGRPSRRRRGRGRGRSRGGPSVLAPGAYPHDPHAPAHADDDDEDDDAADDAGHAEGAERERAAEPPPPSPEPAAPERPFSIFSWLRRDQPAEPGVEARPPEGTKPEE